MTETTQKIGSFSSLETALSVANSSSVFSSSLDLTAAIPLDIVVQFGVSQADDNDVADIEFGVQYSEDGSTWPDDGQYNNVFSWPAENAGDDLTRSKEIVLTPSNQHVRFVVINNNATDLITAAIYVAKVTLEHN